MTSSTTRLYLVRHGQVESAWRGRIYGCHDVALSELGENEARAASARLDSVRLDRVVSSGLRRTEYGAACIRGSRGLERMDDVDLRELDRGDWVGLRPEETPARGWSRWQERPHALRPPGGENLRDLADRVLPRLAAHAREELGGAVAVVAHSWVVRVALAHALDLALARAPRLVVPTGSVHVLDWPVGADGSVGGPRPTLVALGVDAPPPAGRGWFSASRR